MIDSSVVNIAVPDIVTDLHTSLGTAAWTVSGYLLGLAAGLAAIPWLARRFGILPAYQAALAAVSAAGALAALALRGPGRRALPTGGSPCDDG